MAVRQVTTVLVQYIAVRGDLVDKWPMGAIIAQACHASTAVLHMFRDDPNSLTYLGDVDRMHKVVLKVTVVKLYTSGPHPNFKYHLAHVFFCAIAVWYRLQILKYIGS